MFVPFALAASLLMMHTLQGDSPAPAGAEIHPILTEVLFSVPPREVGGDVNLDSLRSNTGDEFVELFNPHDKPINLAGYKLSDADKQFDPFYEFVFPDFELDPYEVVVVFNGFRSDEIPGADGDSHVAPTMKNPHFGNAWVFRVDPERGWQSFSNEADFVLLSAPDGTPLEAVEWGDKKDALPPGMPRNKIYSVPWDITESVQRLGSTDQWLPHTQINGKYFSPGEVPTRRMPILPK